MCDEDVLIYTAAVYPTIPAATDCAYAVVVCKPPAIDQLLISPEDLELFSGFFQVHQTGKLPGRQSINRAELYAVLVAVEAFPTCRIAWILLTL